MRILLTGHDGYIGAVMAPRLLAEGFEVVGLDSGYFDGCDFGDYAPAYPRLRRDLRGIEARDLDGFDAVVHLAAISNDPLGDLNPQCTYDINHGASVRLAEAARSAGVGRYVYSSSCSVYGAADPSDVLDETASFNPLTPYGRSKVMVEDDVRKLAGASFSPVFMRNATAYGVSPRLRGDLVVNNLVGWAVTTGRVFIKSDGTPWRPLVHILDISDAFVAALRAPRERVHNEAFNVGAEGENYRISDIATLVERAVPGSRVEYAADAGPDPRCYRVSFAKIAKALPEFRPRWNVERGVIELRDAFQSIGLTQADLEGDRYLRIRKIRWLLDTGKLDSDLCWVKA
jgi:nucleoside-diphosphate-sugar epimerase